MQQHIGKNEEEYLMKTVQLIEIIITIIITLIIIIEIPSYSLIKDEILKNVYNIQIYIQ